MASRISKTQECFRGKSWNSTLHPPPKKKKKKHCSAEAWACELPVAGLAKPGWVADGILDISTARLCSREFVEHCQAHVRCTTCINRRRTRLTTWLDSKVHNCQHLILQIWFQKITPPITILLESYSHKHHTVCLIADEDRQLENDFLHKQVWILAQCQRWRRRSVDAFFLGKKSWRLEQWWRIDGEG